MSKEVSPPRVALPTLWESSLLALSAAPRATLLLLEVLPPISLATLEEVLREAEPLSLWAEPLSLWAEERST